MVVSSAYFRKSIYLEYGILSWNIIGVAILGWIVPAIHSVALTAFGFLTLMAAGTSLVAIWKLKEQAKNRRKKILRVISMAYIALGGYLIFQNNWNLIYQVVPAKSLPAVTWVGLTVIVMGLSALKKNRFGHKLHNDTLLKSGRSTLTHAGLGSIVFVSMILLSQINCWRADVVAGFILMGYCFYECRQTWVAARNQI